MIEETLAKLESRINLLTSVSDERKTELKTLFTELKSEVVELSKTQSEDAESITRFAEISAYEATRPGKNAALSELSLQGFSTSVDGFEASHPRLVSIVNSICSTLSNFGI